MLYTFGMFDSLDLPRGFWDMESCSKRDVLTERQHTPVILEALADRETRIEQLDAGCFIFYAEEEALRIEATSPILIDTILICQSLLALPRTHAGLDN